MKKLKKNDLEKRLEMLDKLSTDESNKLIGGYDWYGPSVNVGGVGSVTPTVSVILGHSNISTTLNLYVYPNMEQKRKSIDQMVKTLR